MLQTDNSALQSPHPSNLRQNLVRRQEKINYEFVEELILYFPF